MHDLHHAPPDATKTIQCDLGFTGLLWSGGHLLRRGIGVGVSLDRTSMGALREPVALARSIEKAVR